VTGGRQRINRRVEARGSSGNKLFELYLDFFPANVARILQSACNYAAAELPSSTRRDRPTTRQFVAEFVCPLSLSLNNFLEIAFFMQYNNPQNWQEHVLLIRIFLQLCADFIFMFLLLCQIIWRVVAKAYWNKHSTSRRPDWSATYRFFNSWVHTTGGKTSEGIDVLLRNILSRVISTCSFNAWGWRLFLNKVELSASSPK
jgi:hypothetical protein